LPQGSTKARIFVTAAPRLAHFLMADVIQFHCPACGTTLRLPLEMAARQGPCPCCTRVIVAPDPYRGTGAFVPAPPPTPAYIEPFRPFADSPPLVPKDVAMETSAPELPPVEKTPEEPAPPRQPAEETSRPQCQHEVPPSRAVFVLSLLLASVVSLFAGYLLGARSNWLVSRTPYPVMHVPKLETKTEPATKTVLIKPQIPTTEVKADPAPVSKPETKPEPKAEPVKASTAAETALKAFLDAPDWTTRSAYVLFPDKVRAAMEDYSRKVPDGATPFQSISVQNSYTDKDTGSTMFIFGVTTTQHPTGIPVAVMETKSGWQVDWQSFIEFRDDLFRTFADGPVNQRGRFHLLVSAPPASRAAKTENEHFSTLLLDPPFPGRQRLAYVKKTASFHAELLGSVDNGAVSTPLLEVEKRSTPDGKTYLEITGMIASDWLPREP
jgi:hypothetical protein